MPIGSKSCSWFCVSWWHNHIEYSWHTRVLISMSHTDSVSVLTMVFGEDGELGPLVPRMGVVHGSASLAAVPFCQPDSQSPPRPRCPGHCSSRGRKPLPHTPSVSLPSPASILSCRAPKPSVADGTWIWDRYPHPGFGFLRLSSDRPRL